MTLITTEMFVVYSKQAPTLNEIQQLATDYLGDLCLEHNQSRYPDGTGTIFVTVRGSTSNPYHRVGPARDERSAAGRYWEQARPRRIKIEVRKTSLEVLAPGGDPATCALAQGLVFCAAVRWEGFIQFMPEVAAHIYSDLD